MLRLEAPGVHDAEKRKESVWNICQNIASGAVTQLCEYT